MFSKVHGKKEFAYVVPVLTVAGLKFEILVSKALLELLMLPEICLPVL